MSAVDPRCAMLFEMTGSAHRLGMAFAAEAEQADEIGRKIEYLKLFDRCFFAVRVGIALELRLKREGRWDAARAGREDRDDPADRAELDPPEDERPERPERLRLDADRDREVERATLPRLLDTLRGVAADAQALPGPPPAELPTLRDLLARYAAAPDELPAPAPGQTHRARLASSTAALAGVRTSVRLLTPAADRPLHGLASSKFRRATGPPRI
jgi:hypothetical protein